MILAWRARLAATGHCGEGQRDRDWPEEMALPYETDQPDFDGLIAAQLGAAYTELGNRGPRNSPAIGKKIKCSLRSTTYAKERAGANCIDESFGFRFGSIQSLRLRMPVEQVVGLDRRLNFWISSGK